MSRNEVLHRALQAAGITTTDLAAAIGVDPKSVERWISKGRVPHPRHRIAAATAVREDVNVLWPDVVRRAVKRGADRELVALYPRRSDMPRSLFRDLISAASTRLWFGGYTSYFIWLDTPEAGPTLAAKAQAGADVRFLLGDPASEVTRHRETIEGSPLTIATRIALTQAEIAKTGSSLPVRHSDRHIAMSVWIFDDDALVATHIGDELGQDSVTLHLRRQQMGGAFDRYAEHFEHLWDAAKEDS